MKTKTLISSLLLTLTLTVGLLPTPAIAADVEVCAGKEIAADTSGATRSVYYGTFGGNPLKWRVVQNDGSTMTLLSDGIIKQGEGRTMGGIYISEWLNSTPKGVYGDPVLKENSFIGTSFSAEEENAMKAYGVTETGYGLTSSQKIALPSVDEVIDGGLWGMVSNDRICSTFQWYLRTPGAENNSAYTVAGATGAIGSGNLDIITTCGIRPAFKLNNSSVVMTSPAVSGKAITIGELLKSVAPSGDMKLTIAETDTSALNLSVDAAEKAAKTVKQGATININYTGAITGAGKYVSCVITDASSNVKYYGRLVNCTSGNASGTATISLPSDMPAGSYTIRLFNEKINGDKATDYASTPVDIALVIEYPPLTAALINITSPVFNKNSAAATASGTGYDYTSTAWETTVGKTPLALGTAFATSTAYTATVVLTSNNGYRFANTIAASSVSVTGGTVASAVTTGGITGNTLTVVVNFPATGAPDSTKPVVAAVTPSGTSAEISGELSVTFSEAMNTSTGAVALSSDGGKSYGSALSAVAPTGWSNSNKTYTVQYGGLTNGKAYTIKIEGFEDTAGNIITADCSRSFTTKSAPASGGYTSSEPDIKTTILTSGDKSTVSLAIDAKLNASGIAEVSVTNELISKAIKDAAAEAGKSGAKNIVLDMVIKGTASSKGVTMNIPATAIRTITDSNVSSLKVTSSFGTMSFDAKTLKQFGKESGDVSISVTPVDTTALPQKVQTVIGKRPIYSFKVTCGDKTISDFGGGTVTVSLPYTPAAGENTDKIVIYYISDSGKLSKVPNCVYDAKTGTVTFTTTHFSAYAVGYSDISYSDVSGWYESYVSYLAARDIMSGTSEGVFNPNGTMTRAMAVTVLYRLSGSTGSFSNNFSDVPSGAWFEDAVEWASTNGIVSGVGNGCFAPDKDVTREQLSVILYNYAKYKGLDVSIGNETNILSYKDAKTFSEYAYPALQWACGEKIVSGDLNGNLNPKNNASRAEVAKMLAVFVRNMCGSH